MWHDWLNGAERGELRSIEEAIAAARKRIEELRQKRATLKCRADGRRRIGWPKQVDPEQDR